jgi:hypothetical protein
MRIHADLVPDAVADPQHCLYLLKFGPVFNEMLSAINGSMGTIYGSLNMWENCHSVLLN